MRIWKFIAAVLMIVIMVGCVLFISLLVQNRDDHETESQQTSSQTTAEQENVPTKPTQPKQAKKQVVTEKRLTTPYVSQKPELPNGCEVTSLTMLLQSAKVNVDKLTLASKMKKVPFQSGSFKGNPNEGFVGNMYHGSRANPGLAVYHGPVADLARSYLGNRVIDLSGKPWSAIEKQLISGKPVWTITSINFQPLPDSAWQEWRTRQGTMRITFKEHSVLLTGFDEHNVYFNDPLAGGPGSKSDKQAFIKAWKQFGNQAISYTSEQ